MNNRPKSLLAAAAVTLAAPFALMATALKNKVDRAKAAEERRNAPITAAAALELQRKRAANRSRYWGRSLKRAQSLNFSMGTNEREIVEAAEAKRARKGQILRALTASGAMQGVIGLPLAA